MTNLEQQGWKKVGGVTDENWDREKPIQGIFIESKEDVGPNHSMLYVLEVDDKTWSVWGSTVLDTKFKNIQIGNEVLIEPLGLAKSKAGKEYHDYEVYSRPAPFKKVETAVVSDDNPPLTDDDVEAIS